jgi:single-strand DNA-binding protein
MSECFNTTILVGKVVEGPTEDPESVGSPRVRIVLRTSRQFRARGSGLQRHIDADHCIVFDGKLGLSAKRLIRQGMTLYVQGELLTRSWNDESGQRRYEAVIDAETFSCLTAPSSPSVDR